MSLHRIGQARSDLYDILAPLLPEGRMSAYPAARDVGIQTWIDMPTVQPNRPGQATQIDLDFPIHVTYDGTDEAQVAGLDDLVSRIWDTCERAQLTYPIRVVPGNDRLVGNETRRRLIVTVRRTIAARTLCQADDPATSPIPPDLVLQEA